MSTNMALTVILSLDAVFSPSSSHLCSANPRRCWRYSDVSRSEMASSDGCSSSRSCRVSKRGHQSRGCDRVEGTQDELASAPSVSCDVMALVAAASCEVRCRESRYWSAWVRYSKSSRFSSVAARSVAACLARYENRFLTASTTPCAMGHNPTKNVSESE